MIAKVKLKKSIISKSKHPLCVSVCEYTFKVLFDSSSSELNIVTTSNFCNYHGINVSFVVCKEDVLHCATCKDISALTDSTMITTHEAQCTDLFLSHYSLPDLVEMKITSMDLPDIQKLTVAALTENSYNFLKNDNTSTAILLSLCEKKILMRKNDMFLIPYSKYISNSYPDVIRDLIVIDTYPFCQGLMSLNTEITIIKYFDDTDELKRGNHYLSSLASLPYASNDSSFTRILYPECVYLKNKKVNSFAYNKSSPLILFSHRIMTEFSLRDGDFVLLDCLPSKCLSNIDYDDRLYAQIKSYSPFSQVHESSCYVSTELFFNLHKCSSSKSLHISKIHSAESDISEKNKFSFLPAAQEVHIALIYSPEYPSSINIDQLLYEYFQVTRILRLGYVITLDSKSDSDFYLVCDNEYNNPFPTIYCKVVKISSSNADGDVYCVNREFTNVYQSGPVHSFIPKSLSYSPEKYHNIELLSECFSEEMQQIIDLIKPQILQRKKCFKIPPTLILQGPAACGKSFICEATALFLHMHYIMIDCWSIHCDTTAATEAKIKSELQKVASYAPCVLHFKNVAAISMNSEGADEDHRALSTFIEELSCLLHSNTSKYPIIPICTVIDITSISSEILGHFMHHIEIQSLSEQQRLCLLSSFFDRNSLYGDVNLDLIAKKSSGMVLADISYICHYAKRNAIDQILKERHSSDTSIDFEDEDSISNAGVVLQHSDLENALQVVQSTLADSAGAPKIPNVTWDDVGGLEDVKKEILDTIQLPLFHPELFSSGVQRSGILLYGPPGTGKTLLAKAVATECALNFLSVKGPELLNMYVGQSEENVRNIFTKARENAPCIIFFDELDALAPNRGRSGDSGGVMDRVVSQLLSEMDGLKSSKKVFVIGATNRPDLIDNALLRPGRFEKMIYLGVSSDFGSKMKILKAVTKKFKLDENCDFEKIIKLCPKNLTGADIRGLCSGAMLNCLKKNIQELESGKTIKEIHIKVELEDFIESIKKVTASLSNIDLLKYESLKLSYNHDIKNMP